MEGITLVHLISASATLILMIGLGIYSGRKVSGAADFDTGGGRAGAIMVAGTIIGTLVGGSSTIGTAELAFNFGFSAWWFTLGAAIGCLILAVFFVVPLRNCGCATIQQLIQKHFSPTAGLITSVLATLGLGLNIVSQLLSANVLLSSMFGLNTLTCTAISVVTMACYVIFGGVNSTGLLGIVKSVLLYIAVLVCGGAALVLSGGIGSIQAVLPHDQYFNLFARGVGKDLGAGVSVILGVISTQTYVQALLAGRDSASSRRGALLSALLIPPIGVGGILIGYYMRISFPAMAAGEAFPRFVIQNIPPVLSGVVLATLFIAVVGTGCWTGPWPVHRDHQQYLQALCQAYRQPQQSAFFQSRNPYHPAHCGGVHHRQPEIRYPYLGFPLHGPSGCGAAGAHVRRPVLSLSGRPAVRHRLQHRGHCHPAGSQVPGSARRLPVLGHGRQHPDHRPWLPRAYLSIQIH